MKPSLVKPYSPTLPTVCVAFVWLIVFQSASHAQYPEKIAATVNGDPISMQQLTNASLEAGGQAALHQLIDEALIDQAAGRKHIFVTSAEISRKRSDLSKTLGGESLDQVLQEHDMSLAMFDSGIRHQIELEKLVSVPIRPATHLCHVWHISIGMVYMDHSTNKLRVRTEIQAIALIDSLRKKLANGAKISDLSKRYGDYVGAQQSSGDLGVLYDGCSYYSDLVPTAVKLDAGQFSKTDFKSPAGYELVFVSSTLKHHPKSEDARYQEAIDDYPKMQLDDATPKVLSGLRSAAQIKTYPVSDNPTATVAEVNDKLITVNDLQREALTTVGVSTLQHLIASKLIDEAAQSREITVTQDDLDAKKTEMLSHLAGASIQQGLDKEHMTLAELNSNLTDQVKLEKLSHVDIKLATHMRHVYHIAIAAIDAGADNALPGPPGTTSKLTKDEALAKLQIIREQLKSGADFQSLARQYSDDMFTKNYGGDLGIMHDATQANTDILKVALTLQKGEYSSLEYKSFFGYELVYVESTEEDHPKNEDSLYQEAQNEFRDSQSDASTGDVLQSLEQNAKVKILFKP